GPPVSARTRLGLFLVAGAGLAALLGWGVAGLPAFGDYHGPYGLVLNQVALGQRHTTNVVAAVVFDYRGFDTMGEELMLFAAFVAPALGALAGGLAFQQNYLPLGKIGLLTSSGSIPLLNWATGIEVTAAFVLLFNEFLEEVVVARRERP